MCSFLVLSEYAHISKEPTIDPKTTILIVKKTPQLSIKQWTDGYAPDIRPAVLVPIAGQGAVNHGLTLPQANVQPGKGSHKDNCPGKRGPYGAVAWGLGFRSPGCLGENTWRQVQQGTFSRNNHLALSGLGVNLSISSLAREELPRLGLGLHGLGFRI